MRMTNNICIIGGGISGTLLSIFLARKGYTVDVHEKRFMNEYQNDSQRSIAMSLSHRGIYALTKAKFFRSVVILL